MVERKDYADISKLLKTDPVEVLRSAGKVGMNLTQFCNAVAPDVLLKERWSVTDKLRMELGLSTQNSAFTKAANIDDFLAKGPVGEALLYDVLHRAYHGGRIRSDLISGYETPEDSTIYPAVHGTPRVDKSTDAFLDVNQLLSIEHDIRGTAYKPFRWSYDEDALKRKRTNPGTDLPKATLDYTEDNINLYKWGIGYQVTYEALRNVSTQINKLAQLMELEGQTERLRQLTQLIDVLVTGDGTPNSAAGSVKANSFSTSLSAGEIDAKAWLGFVDSFLPYGITHAIMRADVRRTLFLSTTGSEEVHLVQLLNINAIGVPSLTDLNPNGGISVGAVRNDDLVANTIIGLNASRAVEKVNSAGAAIDEQATNILNQTQLFTMSDTYAYAKMDKFATKLMTLTA